MNGTRNYRYLATLTIVRIYWLGALYFSFGDIRHTFGSLGLTGTRQALSPLLIDGIAILGLIGRSRYFAASTRTIGLRVQVVASVISLVCNVGAGHNAGERIFGAGIVAGYVFAEWYGEHMKPAEVDTDAAAQAAQAAIDQAAANAATAQQAAQAAADQLAAQQAADAAAKRSRTGRKAAATRKRNAATKAQADQLAAEVELATMAAGFVPADAPVSPAPEFRRYL